jgi:basic membrane lipoprotein Med (substrate-binding protein (PBP1-ABC) superfamily)
MFIGCGQGPTFGQIEAAIDEGGVATGYVGDMSDVGDSVLSSFVWELDQVFGLMVEDAANGVTEAQYYEVLLKDGGLSMAISPNWEVPAETMALYEERLAAIIDGSFEVPFIGEAA